MQAISDVAGATATNPATTNGDARWSLARRIGFRFGFAYFVLFAIYAVDIEAGVLIYYRTNTFSDIFPQQLQHALIPWFAQHVLKLHVDSSGLVGDTADTIYDWTLILFDLCFAAFVTAIWSVLDRARPTYARLLSWTLFAMRVLLSSELLFYGLDKVFPVQFHSFGPTDYLTPIGTLTPMGLLWEFMAASNGYTMFAGSVEVLGAVLLPFRRTALLGALVSFLAMSNVFALNIFYNVSVKTISLQLLIIAAFLLLASVGPLANFFLFDRATKPRVEEGLFRSKRASATTQWASVAFLAMFALANSQGVLERYQRQLAAVDPTSPVYGVWAVDHFAGGSAAAWQYVAFDSSKDAVIESIELTGTYASVKLDAQHRTLTLDGYGKPTLTAKLAYKMPTAGHLIVDGTLNGRPFHATLHVLPASTFHHGEFQLIRESSG